MKIKITDVDINIDQCNRRHYSGKLVG